MSIPSGIVRGLMHPRRETKIIAGGADKFFTKKISKNAQGPGCRVFLYLFFFNILVIRVRRKMGAK